MTRHHRIAGLSLMLAGVALIASCAPQAQPMTAAQAAASQTEALCWGYAEYGRIGSDAAAQSRVVVRAELEKRRAIGPDDWSDIDAARISKGISRCEVLAMLGRPTVVNESVNGVEVLGFGSRAFISLHNGFVIAYQVQG
jgi:hypothetical protein